MSTPVFVPAPSPDPTALTPALEPEFILFKLAAQRFRPFLLPAHNPIILPRRRRILEQAYCRAGKEDDRGPLLTSSHLSRIRWRGGHAGRITVRVGVGVMRITFGYSRLGDVIFKHVGSLVRSYCDGMMFGYYVGILVFYLVAYSREVVSAHLGLPWGLIFVLISDLRKKNTDKSSLGPSSPS
ncbi:hypothetical protein C8R45DRAFT_1205409 [Mycena sanguinolenta]|nr:hypothetical protein C8R45DRAFT_1205409 [Mycena sanguinolenta]